MSEVTRMVQAWHNDGDDDQTATYKAAGEIAEATCEKYGLNWTKSQLAELEDILHELVLDSVIWEKIEQDDENARDWEDAKRSALNK